MSKEKGILQIMQQFLMQLLCRAFCTCKAAQSAGSSSVLVIAVACKQVIKTMVW